MMKLKENKVMTIDLDSPNGNAFYLLGTANNSQNNVGWMIYDNRRVQSDYMNLVKTMDKYFPFVVFETNNPEYMEAFHRKELVLGTFMSLTPTASADTVPTKQQFMIDEAFCLAQNVYFETRNQPRGQMAVISVTVNRVNDGRFPNTICGVVYECTSS